MPLTDRSDESCAANGSPPHSKRHVALQPERKQVTVLFVDIARSLETIAAAGDLEWTDAFLESAVGGMVQAVKRYGGTVCKGRGDGIMALFGAPFAREDHTLRACLTAFAVLDFASAGQPSHGRKPLSVRVGIHSGEAIVRLSNFGLSAEYNATGETVHLAARMEQMAEPGSAFLTADSYRNVEGIVRARSLGRLAVRGLLTPVEVYELLGLVPNPSRIRISRFRGLAPFVGRAPELALLDDTARAAHAGHGRIVSIIGEAGSGKSRLIEEFLNREVLASWHILDAACVSYDTSADCAPFAQLIRRHLQLGSEHDRDRLRAVIAEWLNSLGPGLSWAESPILVLFGVDPLDLAWKNLAPAERQQRLTEAIATVLLREARRRPLAIILEDLHWADTGTRNVLELLVDALPTAALLCVISHRPESQFVLQDRSFTFKLRLPALKDPEVEILVEHIVGNARELAATRRLLIARANGNPLFLEECVRSLVDEGLLSGEPGAFHAAREIKSIRLPATVASVISSRIDLLEPTEKGVLQAAAAIGTQIPTLLLSDVVGCSEPDLRQALDRLQRAEFLYHTVFYPEHEYAFRHVLLRDVAYESLLQEQRRTLNRRILESMEIRFEGRRSELAERFAYHAIACGVPKKAVFYARAAAQKATERSACREAIAYYEEALRAIQRLDDDKEKSALEIDLRLDMRYPQMQLGELEYVRETMSRAEAISASIGDDSQSAHICIFLSHISFLMGSHRLAMSYGERSAALARHIGDQDLVERAEFFVGLGYMGLGYLNETLLRMRKTAEYFRARPAHVSHGVGSLVGIALAYQIRALADLGRFDEAAELTAEAYEVSKLEGAFPTLITGVSVGYLYDIRGQSEEAVRILSEVYEASRGARIRVMVPIVQCYLGGAYLGQGKPELAVPLLEAAMEEGTQMRLLYFQSVRMAHLARAALALGAPEKALDLARRALKFSVDQEEGVSETYALLTLAEVLSGSSEYDDHEEARRLVRRAYKKSRNLGLAPARAQCEAALARLYGSAGDQVRAQTYAHRATEAFKRLGAPAQQERALPR